MPSTKSSGNFLYKLSLASFITAIYSSILVPLYAIYRLAFYGTTDILGLILLSALILITFTPLEWTSHGLSAKFSYFTCTAAAEYLPMTVKMEDAEALKPGKSYIIAYEPHSALPVGIPGVFNNDSPLVPKALKGRVYGMASSICFAVPFVRQIWYWFGLRPADRKLLDKLLSTGRSVVVCPGGVQECLHMNHESETVFMRKRFGFVRLALKHGTPLVPSFGFGQRDVYSWHRPGPPLVSDELVRKVSRKCGAVPLSVWGSWGTPVPHKTPVTVCIGKPMEVPRVAEPSDELVQDTLKRFVEEFEAFFEKSKVDCGMPDLQLRIL